MFRADLCEILGWIMGVIFIIIGSSSPTISGGNTQSNDQLLMKDYSAPVTVTSYDDKYATGDLTDPYPECPYLYKDVAQPRGVVYTGDLTITGERHWGQRKLLLTEIDFLNCVTDPSIVVYAGAADGRHLPVLVDMFPHIEFHLYDPRPFWPGIDGHRNIRLNPYYGGATNTTVKTHGWFTDEVAKWYTRGRGDTGMMCLRDGKTRICRSIYFISDIRTEPTEHEIERNQRQQEAWIRIMRPKRSMIKFKCPYPKIGAPRLYRHLAGTVRLQCWAPVRSAETRLIIDSTRDRKWDIVKWERNLAWYNTVMRQHDFSDRQLRDFGVPVDGTVAEFWRDAGVVTDKLGFDFVYELQILAVKSPSRAELLDRVKKINTVLISKGAQFVNYLKSSA